MTSVMVLFPLMFIVCGATALLAFFGPRFGAAERFSSFPLGATTVRNPAVKALFFAVALYMARLAFFTYVSFAYTPGGLYLRYLFGDFLGLFGAISIAAFFFNRRVRDEKTVAQYIGYLVFFSTVILFVSIGDGVRNDAYWTLYELIVRPILFVVMLAVIPVSITSADNADGGGWAVLVIVASPFVCALPPLFLGAAPPGSGNNSSRRCCRVRMRCDLLAVISFGTKMRRRDGVRRRGVRRTMLLLTAAGVAATGCSRSVELRVPFSLDQEPFTDDLRGSGVALPIVAGNDGFQVCDRESDRCVPVEFVDDHLESTVIDAVAFLRRRTGAERVVLLAGASRRSRLESMDFQSSDIRTPSGAEAPFVALYRRDGESIDTFLKRAVEAVDLEKDGIVAILGEHTPDLVRRLGRSDRAVGVIPELFLSGAIDRLRSGGYPIIGSISPDMTKIPPRELPEDRVTIYVDLRLYRY